MATTPTRLHDYTLEALKIAWKKPFLCSIPEFLARVENGDDRALRAWRREAKRLADEAEQEADR
jgi:hypothetical protein